MSFDPSMLCSKSGSRIIGQNNRFESKDLDASMHEALEFHLFLDGHGDKQCREINESIQRVQLCQMDKRPASRTDSLIPAKSPFDALSNETLHRFIPVGFQVAPQGLYYQTVDIGKPSRLYLLLGLFGQT